MRKIRSEALKIKRDLWAYMQPKFLHLYSQDYPSVKSWWGNVGEPLTFAVAWGIITLDDAKAFIDCDLREENEKHFLRWNAYIPYKET
jgi:hypothetical protein